MVLPYCMKTVFRALTSAVLTERSCHGPFMAGYCRQPSGCVSMQRDRSTFIASCRVVVLISLAVVLLFASAEGKRPASGKKTNPSQNETCELLVEARDAYVADGAGATANPRVLMYAWQRESISQSPLLNIATGLAAFEDDTEAIETAKAIAKADLRAYALISIAGIQSKHDRTEQAEKSLQQAIELIASKEVEESRSALWPHVLRTLLWIHNDVDAAKAAAERAGCPWDAMDKEERQYQLARFRLANGQLEKAREALLVLPPETFAQRKGQQALRGDDGAGFYAWIGRSVTAAESYTADHVMLEWLQNDGRLDQIEAILQHLDDADPCKATGYVGLSERYAKTGDANKAIDVLDKAEQLLALNKTKDSQERVKFGLAIARRQIEGKSMAQAIKEADVLKKYHGEQWLSSLIPPLLQEGELELATTISEECKLDDQLHGYFAVALTKAKRHDEAALHIKQATGLLGRPKILIGVALQYHENDDHEAAKKTILAAIAEAKKVRSTNNWFPEEGEVRLEEKWFVMARLYETAIVVGQGEEVIRQFNPNDASIRAVARAFGARREIDLVRKLIAGFNESTRKEGGPCLALLGYVEGLSTAK